MVVRTDRDKFKVEFTAPPAMKVKKAMKAVKKAMKAVKKAMKPKPADPAPKDADAAPVPAPEILGEIFYDPAPIKKEFPAAGDGVNTD